MAFLGLAVVGCLTPTSLLFTRYINPEVVQQYEHLNPIYQLAFGASVVIGGIVAVLGLTGYLVLRKGSGHS